VPAIELLQYVIAQPGPNPPQENRVEDWGEAYHKLQIFKREQGVNGISEDDIAQHFNEYGTSDKRLYLNVGETNEQQTFIVTDESKLFPNDHGKEGDEKFPVYFAAQLKPLDAMNSKIVNMRRGTIFICDGRRGKLKNIRPFFHGLAMAKKRGAFNTHYPCRCVATSVVLGSWMGRKAYDMALNFIGEDIPKHMKPRLNSAFDEEQFTSKNAKNRECHKDGSFKYIGDQYGPGILPFQLGGGMRKEYTFFETGHCHLADNPDTADEAHETQVLCEAAGNCKWIKKPVGLEFKDVDNKVIVTKVNNECLSQGIVAGSEILSVNNLTHRQKFTRKTVDRTICDIVRTAEKAKSPIEIHASFRCPVECDVWEWIESRHRIRAQLSADLKQRFEQFCQRGQDDDTRSAGAKTKSPKRKGRPECKTSPTGSPRSKIRRIAKEQGEDPSSS